MTNPKTLLQITFAAAIVAAGFVGTAAQAQQQPPQSQQAPAPRILVIESARVVQNSKVGKEIARQIMVYQKQAEADFNGRRVALQKEQQDLQQKSAILSKAALAQKQKDFQAKVNALQQFGDTKRSLIQGGAYKAQMAVEAAMRPIFDAVLKAHGANLLVEKNYIMASNINIDATDEVVRRLDAALPTLKVELVPLPANVAAAAQAAAAQQQQQQR